jgi:hypothetical protein
VIGARLLQRNTPPKLEEDNGEWAAPKSYSSRTLTRCFRSTKEIASTKTKQAIILQGLGTGNCAHG